MKIRATVAAAVGFVTLGCVTGPMEIAKIAPGQSIAEAIQSERSLVGWEMGPEVSGEKCETAVFGLIPVTPRASERDAVRAAIESAQGRWAALVQAKLTMTQYPYVVARTLCWEVAGRVARPSRSQAHRR
ncbi:MAG: hypothetical protein NXI30_18905 [bacterium]|nr:hypothetical protein [bacterium]